MDDRSPSSSRQNVAAMSDVIVRVLLVSGVQISAVMRWRSTVLCTNIAFRCGTRDMKTNWCRRSFGPFIIVLRCKDSYLSIVMITGPCANRRIKNIHVRNSSETANKVIVDQSAPKLIATVSWLCYVIWISYNSTHELVKVYIPCLFNLGRMCQATIMRSTISCNSRSKVHRRIVNPTCTENVFMVRNTINRKDTIIWHTAIPADMLDVLRSSSC